MHTAINIARQMIGSVQKKQVTLINLTDENSFLKNKSTQIKMSSALVQACDHPTDVIYGIDLLHNQSKKIFALLKKHLKPNTIVVSIQKTHVHKKEIDLIKTYFTNVVVTYCNLLPDKLRSIEKCIFFLFPWVKKFSRFQIVRVQQHAPNFNSDRKQIHKTDVRVFDKDYFTEYYEPMTGAFSAVDLQRNKNWFYGWFQKLNDFFPFKKGKGEKILEIGCSIGAAADILSKRGFEVTATDISHFAVENAKKLLPHINFEILDIDAKPVKQNYYDLIYAFEVIEHLENPRRCLSHMYTMLKPGGKLICSTPYPYPYVYFDETHISVKYPDEWIKLFKGCGFKQVKYKQIGFIPFFYRFSKYLHITLPFGLDTKYINSPVFLYGEK